MKVWGMGGRKEESVCAFSLCSQGKRVGVRSAPVGALEPCKGSGYFQKVIFFLKGASSCQVNNESYKDKEIVYR